MLLFVIMSLSQSVHSAPASNSAGTVRGLSISVTYTTHIMTVLCHLLVHCSCHQPLTSLNLAPPIRPFYPVPSVPFTPFHRPNRGGRPAEALRDALKGSLSELVCRTGRCCYGTHGYQLRPKRRRGCECLSCDYCWVCSTSTPLGRLTPRCWLRVLLHRLNNPSLFVRLLFLSSSRVTTVPLTCPPLDSSTTPLQGATTSTIPVYFFLLCTAITSLQAI